MLVFSLHDIGKATAGLLKPSESKPSYYARKDKVDYPHCPIDSLAPKQKIAGLLDSYGNGAESHDLAIPLGQSGKGKENRREEHDRHDDDAYDLADIAQINPERG